ncbi:hypothetical protein PUNSTDRAFT_128616 [Punctularia strigosozonata HHB-11173 SS5]|uniref:BTB domain-containing protein n=1 Tax=Punctularia strigosozonata (strain HHB-11173) TaxID=741275 RepID=R7S3S9_PUNST|nr:uncharacterized protein PUNSTDRAFT_128616 [Punctularia strigosozonata HHB-11173 SS5]EIN03886.1 hypothetical protein PUNSTDRAFT_128616 [Punctularia strigosozonata HHB-11173 SS5]
MTSEPEIVDADHPFNKPSADLILRTSDNVDFHVHKSILSEASPVFETMLSLPQPRKPVGLARSPSTKFAEQIQELKNGRPVVKIPELKNGRPVVKIPETAASLAMLLQICYPYKDPDMSDLDDTMEVLVAAIKYEMDHPTTVLSQRLQAHATTSPLRVYAFAVHRRLEEEARFAARASLRFGLNTLISQDAPEMFDISGVDYQRLMRYVVRCQTELPLITKDLSWLPKGRPFEQESGTVGWETGREPPWYGCGACRGDFGVSAWWDPYLGWVRQRLAERPSGAVLLGMPALVDQASREMGLKCWECRTVSGLGSLRAFTKYLAMEVDRRTAEIAANTTFC